MDGCLARYPLADFDRFLCTSWNSALLACWFSRPLTRRDATALLGVYLLLIIATIEFTWALSWYAPDIGFLYFIGGLALLSAFFFAMAYVKRAPKREQHDLSALHDSGP